MKITIKKEVFDFFNPDFKVAFLLIDNIDNQSKLPEANHLLNETQKMVQLTFNKDNIQSHYLIAPWTAAKKGFGAKAKHYQTSVEQLLHRVLKNKSVASKDVLTTLLNYLALKHIVPYGVDDLGKIQGNLTFDLAKGTEKIDGNKSIKKGTLLYHDQKKILGIKLDYWKNKSTRLNEKSRSALVHFEALPPLDKKKLDDLVTEAMVLISNFCRGKIKVFILDQNKRVQII